MASSRISLALNWKFIVVIITEMTSAHTGFDPSQGWCFLVMERYECIRREPGGGGGVADIRD